MQTAQECRRQLDILSQAVAALRRQVGHLQHPQGGRQGNGAVQQWHRMLNSYVRQRKAKWGRAVADSWRGLTARRQEAERNRQAAVESRQQRQQQDLHKAEAARARRKGVMINRWRQLQRQLEEAPVVNKHLRGEVYAVADRTLVEAAKSSLQQAVRARLGGAQPGTWTIGRAQLQEEALRVAMHDNDGDGREALLGAVRSVVNTLQSEGNTKEAVQAMGTALYAAVRTGVNLTSATEVWDQRQFHAVRIKMSVQSVNGLQQQVEVIGDTGAGVSLFPLSDLPVEIQTNGLKPGRAKLLHSASAHAIKSAGGATMQFRLGQ